MDVAVGRDGRIAVSDRDNHRVQARKREGGREGGREGEREGGRERGEGDRQCKGRGTERKRERGERGRE